MPGKSIWFEPATGRLRTDDPGDSSTHANYRIDAEDREKVMSATKRIVNLLDNEEFMSWLRKAERKHSKNRHGDTPAEVPVPVGAHITKRGRRK